MSNHPLAKQVLRYIDSCRTFALPSVTPGKKQFILCPVSGGIDSTAVAIIMAVLYPQVPVTYVYTGTGIDADGTDDVLSGIERLSGRPVLRIKPGKDLLDITIEQGNFLPSQRQRWCTQLTKIKPFKNFMAALNQKHPDAEFVSLVGIRADEPEREGVSWSETNIRSLFPLQELGLVKADVNRIVQEILGIPTYYSQKSRSGCFVCIFHRRSEVIGAWRMEPDGMKRASLTECLPAEYEAVLDDLPPNMYQRTGLAENWMRMAVPKEIGGVGMSWSGQRGVARHGSNRQDDLFSHGNKTFFVAVEHHYGQVDIFGPEEVYFQRLVTYSTSLGGLKTSLKHHWIHKFNTKELYGIESEDELASGLKIGIYVIDLFDAYRVVPEAPEGIYTWQNDRTPLKLIKKTSYILRQCLLEEGLIQDAKSGCSIAMKHVKRIKDRLGEVLHGSLYTPMQIAELITDMDITDAPEMCNACSR
ncbi:hypothetical protein [Rheinheimera hassiensis]|uniref:hypothetical protein n=1 Tax=Rheinheimera hassiensis TaxID=1193627 RepID=UPI001F0601BB|nr:hypothetical protein [Rheinheimera hassiensis]